MTELPKVPDTVVVINGEYQAIPASQCDYDALRAAAEQVVRERDELLKLINDDGSLESFEEHRSILCDAMGALKVMPDIYKLNEELATVPAGHCVVPVEPTKAMIQAGLVCQEFNPDYSPESEMYYLYKAMLTAARKP